MLPTLKVFDLVWKSLIDEIISGGVKVSPRGNLTLEIPQKTISVDMRFPVLVNSKRSLSYKFMAAEALWILTGDNRVESIAKYNSRIREFSDDGVTFFGAYGPRIATQLDYVITKLRSDPDTRQAGLTIWRENPPATKDVPCTVAIFFNIRQDQINCHVFMRSSDAWLGVPYDVFNFSMLSYAVCNYLNNAVGEAKYSPGMLHLTAASSHLYSHNIEDARICLHEDIQASIDQLKRPPDCLYNGKRRNTILMDSLHQIRESRPGDACRWWLTGILGNEHETE